MKNLLTAEAVPPHILKGYRYFAMSFALVVDLLNVKMTSRKRRLKAEHTTP